MPPTHAVEYDADTDRGRIRTFNLEAQPPEANEYVDEIRFQHGTIPENGVNGVTNEALLDLLALRIRALQQRFPCRENALAITNIEQARMWLQERTQVRIDQGVEGKYENHVTKGEQLAHVGS